ADDRRRERKAAEGGAPSEGLNRHRGRLGPHSEPYAPRCTKARGPVLALHCPTDPLRSSIHPGPSPETLGLRPPALRRQPPLPRRRRRLVARRRLGTASAAASRVRSRSSASSRLRACDRASCATATTRGPA